MLPMIFETFKKGTDFLARSPLYIKKHFIPLCLIIAPIILLLAYIRIFGVSVVYWDSWEFVPLLDHFYSGTLTLGQLFAQANEHRIFFFRLIFLAVTPISHWDETWLMYLSWVTLVLDCLLIFLCYRRNLTITVGALFFFIPIPWLLFNFRQWEGILQGLPLTIYLCVSGFLISVTCLTLWKDNYYSLFIAILGGVLSTFSFINGLLTWPICFILIALVWDNRKKFLVLWGIASVLIYIAYFVTWVKPGGHPSLLFAVEKPVAGGIYFTCNVGFPLGYDAVSSTIMGIIALCVLLFLAWSLYRYKLVKENGIWISLILFSLATSLMMTVGRSGFGTAQALSSRYVAFTVIGIIGLYLLAVSVYGRLSDKNKHWGIVLGVIIGMIIFGVISGNYYGINCATSDKMHREQISQFLLGYSHATDDQLKQLYPVPKVVRTRAPFLEQHHLNVFYGERGIVNSSGGKNTSLVSSG